MMSSESMGCNGVSSDRNWDVMVRYREWSGKVQQRQHVWLHRGSGGVESCIAAGTA